MRKIKHWIVKARQLYVRKPNRFVRRIDALFCLLESVVPATVADAEWLSEIKDLALRGKIGWKLRLDVYLRGLTTGKSERIEAIELVRANLMDCPEGNITLISLVMPLVWAATISIIALSTWWSTWGIALYWILLPVVFAFGILISMQIPFFDRSLNFGIYGFEKVLGVCFYATYLVAVTYITPTTSSVVMKWASQNTFKQERDRLNSDPQGFPMLRRFAKDMYGLDVILGDAQTSWISTETAMPGASVASMSLRSGYCLLSINRAHMLRDFGPANASDSALWTQGVMMHEFGHCLDSYRDLPGFNIRQPSTFALSPQDATQVKDIQTYIEAAQKDSSQLWREALADIFAVGFWRLAAPVDASRFVATLRAKRAENAHTDQVHATMCWIDQASRAQSPASYKDLMRWADQQRSSANCSTRISSNSQNR